MGKNIEVSDDKKKLYLAKAEDKAKDLQSLISQFFMLSVIEEKDYKLNIEKINLSELTFDTVTSFYNQFEESSLELDLQIESEDLFVFADTIGTKRVIENLMGNVIKHSYGKVKISLVRKDDKVVLEVVNKADDLNKEDISVIFNKFYKHDVSRSNNINTGLGLAIVKTLIEKMYGSVDAKYEAGYLYIICNFKI